jgi:hypothetical protein
MDRYNFPFCIQCVQFLQIMHAKLHQHKTCDPLPVISVEQYEIP